MVSLGLLLLRTVVGAIFILHAIPKFKGGPGKSAELSDQTKEALGEAFVGQYEGGGVEQTAGMMESIGLPNPKQSAWALIVVEGLGGLALILGWRTRFWASALTVSQAVAIQKVHKDEGLVGGYELNATLMAATGSLALSGPGKIAID